MNFSNGGMRVALLTDLAEALTPEARSSEAALGFEIISALRQAAAEIGGFSVDVVGRRGSSRQFPLLSIDPEEIPLRAGSDVRLRQEALYTEFVLSGMLRDYNLVHCLAPLVTPIQVLLSLRQPVLQTWTVSPADPAARLLPALAPPRFWRATVLQPELESPRARCIAPGIDLERFRGGDGNRNYVLWMGERGQAAEARTIARNLGLPLRDGLQGSAVEDLRRARVFLDLSEEPRAVPPIWAIRALACGTPVAGWRGGPLQSLVEAPEIGALAPPRATSELAAAVSALPELAAAAPFRRQLVLRRFAPRPMAAAYLAEYRSLIEA